MSSKITLHPHLFEISFKAAKATKMERKSSETHRKISLSFYILVLYIITLYYHI